MTLTPTDPNSNYTALFAFLLPHEAMRGQPRRGIAAQMRRLDEVYLNKPLLQAVVARTQKVLEEMLTDARRKFPEHNTTSDEELCGLLVRACNKVMPRNGPAYAPPEERN